MYLTLTAAAGISSRCSERERNQLLPVLGFVTNLSRHAGQMLCCTGKPLWQGSSQRNHSTVQQECPGDASTAPDPKERIGQVTS